MKVKLDVNVDELLPGHVTKIGSQSIVVRPLNLMQYTLIVRRLKSLVANLTQQGITLENYFSPENLLIIADVLVNDFTDILSELTGIEIESLFLLPKEIIVELLVISLEVNMQSNDIFVGNLKSLTGLINKALPVEKQGEKKEKGPKK